MFRYGEYPMLRLVFPFILGILARWHSGIDGGPRGTVLLGLLILTCCVAALASTGYRSRWVSGLALYVGFFLAGWNGLAVSTSITGSKLLNRIPDGEKKFVVARLVEPPEYRDGGTVKATVSVIPWNDTLPHGLPAPGLAYIESDSTSLVLDAGDVVAGYATVSDPPGPMNPGSFNYGNYLGHQGIKKTLRFEAGDHAVIEHGRISWLDQKALQFGGWAKGIFLSQGFDEQELSVALALILGMKQDLDRELYERYAGAGVVHILCVSGLHVGILWLMLDIVLYPLAKVRRGRWFRAILILFIIWFYALVTGLSPSVTRASTMFSLVTAGKLMSRRHNVFNTIAGSAMLLLIFDPHNLFRIGFQLSYLAVLGIVVLQPSLFNQLRTSNRILNKMLALLTVSFCAQLATAPLSIYYFGRFPVWFLLSNLVAVPLAGILLHLAMALLVFDWIGPVQRLIGILLDQGLKALNLSVAWVDSLPGAVVDGLSIDAALTLICYSAIVCLVFLIRTVAIKWGMALMASLSVLALYSSFNFSRQAGQERVVFYRIPGHTAIDLIRGKQHSVLSDSLLQADEKLISYNLEGAWRKYGLKETIWIDLNDTVELNDRDVHVQKGFICFGDTRIGLVDSSFSIFPIKDKIRVDYLFLYQDPGITLEALRTAFDFKSVILDASNKPWNVARWMEEAAQTGIECHSIYQDGAVVLEGGR